MDNLFLILFLLSFVGLIVGLISPSSVIRWGNKRTRGRVFLTYGLAMVVFFILFGVTTPPVEKEKERLAAIPSATKEERQKSGVAPAPTVAQEKIAMPKYSVLDEDVYDDAGATKITFNILVSGKITEPGLRALLNKLYSSTKARRGFKYHDSPTNIYIYAFTSKERAGSGMGQWIAMLQKNRDDGKPTISINERQIAQLGAKPKERFGLSEKKRKEIWQELVLAEDRARKRAEEQYPLDPTQSLRVGQVFPLSKQTPLMPELEPADPMAALQKMRRLPPETTIKVLRVAMKKQTAFYFVEATSPSKVSRGSGWINSIALIGQGQVDSGKQLEKQAELENRLIDKYKDELAKKYGLTRKQLGEISLEVFKKDWSFPKLE